MRERHNIVGTEVGRPRPPIYMRHSPKFQKRKSAASWLWSLAALCLAALCLTGLGVTALAIAAIL